MMVRSCASDSAKFENHLMPDAANFHQFGNVSQLPSKLSERVDVRHRAAFLGLDGQLWNGAERRVVRQIETVREDWLDGCRAFTVLGISFPPNLTFSLAAGGSAVVLPAINRHEVLSAGTMSAPSGCVANDAQIPQGAHRLGWQPQHNQCFHKRQCYHISVSSIWGAA